MFKRKPALEIEIEKLNKQEAAYRNKHQNASETKLNQLLENKVPEKLQGSLDLAFSKAFSLMFQKGTGIIEKTYNKEEMENDYKVDAYAHSLRNNKKSLTSFSKKALGSAKVNLAISGVSGVCLGILGIGLPDITVFTGLLLKSLYQTSLHYGFLYSDESEKRFLLLLIRGALSYGDEFIKIDQEIDNFIQTGVFSHEEELEIGIKKTSACFSKELLYMKFLQGIPIVGVVGGVYDPVYIKRINHYAELKYRKRFLLLKSVHQ